MSEMGLGCVKTPVAEAADDSRFRRSGRVGSSCGVWRFFCLERLLMRIPAVLRGSATGYSTCLRRLCPHRRQQRLDAHDVHDAREIVGQYVQGHLSSNPGATSSSGSSHPSPPVADISAYNAFKGSKASMRRAMGTTDTRRSEPRAPSGVNRRASPCPSEVTRPSNSPPKSSPCWALPHSSPLHPH
jgi:hypothetical protein